MVGNPWKRHSKDLVPSLPRPGDFVCEVTHELHFFSVSHSWSGYSTYFVMLRLLGVVSGIRKHLYLPAPETTVNQAFQYSSITSVTILDCWTIAWVILLTWYFLGTRYSLWQFFGAAVCVAGLGLVLLSDAGVGGGGGSRPLLGDTFVIMGTLFFALSNVGEEICVKKKDRIEVITMMAISGLLVSICEIAILETKGLASVKWSPEIILAFAGFAFAGFLFYTFVPFLLKMSGATLFNLSLLTSDMWAVVIRIFFYKQEVDWLYYVAFGLVGIGLVVYSKTEKALDSAPAIGDGSQYQILDEECRDARNDDVGDRS